MSHFEVSLSHFWGDLDQNLLDAMISDHILGEEAWEFGGEAPSP